MSNPMIVVVGAGPGVSAAVAQRFGTEGYDVALLGLGGGMPAGLSGVLRSLGVAADWVEADVTDNEALTGAIQRFGEDRGRIDVLHFNPSAYREKDPLELTVPELLSDVALGAGALLTAVQAARPYLRRGARVTATGSVAADQPSHRAASLGVQKAALRNLVHSVDRTLEPEGIRAVTVTVEGLLDRDDESSPFHPTNVAEAIFTAAQQEEGQWRSEVRHPGT